MSKVAVIYYSATGHGTTMARRVAAAAETAGAEVRVRHVAETRDPESFAQNPAWTANYEATKDLPPAIGDDIVWADAVIFGSPTRFGSVASQMRNYLDSLGGLWSEGNDQLKFVDGNPYGASLIAGHDDIGEFDDATNNALDHLAKGVVSVTERLVES